MPSPRPPLRRWPRPALTLGLVACALVAHAPAQPRSAGPDPVVPLPLAEAAEVIEEVLERHGFEVTQPRAAELWIELWVKPQPRPFTERPTPPIVPLSFESIWEASYGDDASPKPQDQRVELGGWIVDEGGGTYSFQGFEGVTATTCNISGLRRSMKPANAVAMVHTHPFEYREVITAPSCLEGLIIPPGAVVRAGHESKADRSAAARLGIKAYLIDADRVLQYHKPGLSSSSTWRKRHDRCGY